MQLRQCCFQDLPELESRIEDPWAHLFLIMHSIGRKLGWEMSSMFAQPCGVDIHPGQSGELRKHASARCWN
ncbi:hypothetical protein PR048_019147 [Dryococelus australis]|uniref:Uncharacterized protein n=1 Tax=Dryococelus australis TaxID=614101 RepID=A0ABQ9H2Q1_9NEOP|nr:hypothetical protein PR048_019147 [Dryococelus australis]